MMPKRKKTLLRDTNRQPGQIAKSEQQTLRTFDVGAVPIINRVLERMDLEAILRAHLRPDSARVQLPTATGILVLVRNVLISREPFYGIGDWAARYAPDLLGMTPRHLQHFNDDRIGRCMDRLFETLTPTFVMTLVRHVTKEFQLSLAELHNDSTTVSFFGSYDEAAEASSQRGHKTAAITYGFSKAHRPDLKQLLYILTITDDGGVPVYFTTENGNTTDDTTHVDTWNLLRELVGSPDFLYVADCKLATTDNMKHIDQQGGRFVSILPKTRKEDQEFRQRLLDQPEAVAWDPLYDIRDDEGAIIDQLRVCPEETLTSERFRLWWFHSTRKSRLDAKARLKRIERAIIELGNLRKRLTGPRPRLRTKEQVEPVVADLLKDTGAAEWLRVEVHEYYMETFRQTTPGRPGKNTEYRRETKPFCDLSWEIDTKAMAESEKGDGVFPLVTNARDLTAEEVLQAYKRQPTIEKRFSQLKTDFAVAPVCLKNVSRIQALFGVYFLALMVQTLLERELRNAMRDAQLESLPLYPEGRDCKAPTARRIIDVFEPVQRHTLAACEQSATFTTELSQLHRQILKLLNIPSGRYGL